MSVIAGLYIYIYVLGDKELVESLKRNIAIPDYRLITAIATFYLLLGYFG